MHTQSDGDGERFSFFSLFFCFFLSTETQPAALVSRSTEPTTAASRSLLLLLLFLFSFLVLFLFFFLVFLYFFFCDGYLVLPGFT